ncbi:hypothetical protein KY311_00030 [Candidatus Woesearchaeota archaeon]|nr:hypothetical protein [Candidatus Woesearchaeota archaeon]
MKKSQLDQLEKEIRKRNKALQKDIALLKSKSYSKSEHPVKKLAKAVAKRQTVDHDPLLVQPEKLKVDRIAEKIEKQQARKQQAEFFKPVKHFLSTVFSALKVPLELAVLSRQDSRPIHHPQAYPRRKMTVLKVSLATLLILTILFSIYFVQGVFATTEKTFVALSQNCLYSNYDQEITGGSVVTNKARGCSVTREITKVAESEPIEVKYLLEGKKMVCHFERGEFDENNLDYMTQDLDKCEGELKDILLELMR